MKKIWKMTAVFASISIFVSACGITSISNSSLPQTQVALGIQSTQLSLQQTQIAQQAVVPSTTAPEPTLQPTYTPYPTYTIEATQQQPTTEATQQQPTTEATQTETTSAEAGFIPFDQWKKEVSILLYDDMYRYLDSGNMIMKALEGLGMGANVTNTRDAMGTFMSNLNSGTQWDLIIMGGESHDAISGDFFDLIADQVNRDVSVIIEMWYISDVYHGQIQPLMQRCGIDYHKDWQRAGNANLNNYLIYLLDPSDPLFSNPNTISMLIPSSDFWWTGDVGDYIKLVPGSDAKILAGAQPREYSSYGLISECMDGRMIWQTFDTHDYKFNDMINLWQNYIINTLQARYEYVN